MNISSFFLSLSMWDVIEDQKQRFTCAGFIHQQGTFMYKLKGNLWLSFLKIYIRKSFWLFGSFPNQLQGNVFLSIGSAFGHFGAFGWPRIMFFFPAGYFWVLFLQVLFCNNLFILTLSCRNSAMYISILYLSIFDHWRFVDFLWVWTSHEVSHQQYMC